MNGPSRRTVGRRGLVQSINEMPSFTIKIQATFINNGFVHIPLEFRDKFMKTEGECSGLVTLRVNEETWTLNLWNRCDRLVIGRASKFLRDNALESGNLCTFQLISSNPFTFLVNFNRTASQDEQRQITRIAKPPTTSDAHFVGVEFFKVIMPIALSSHQLLIPPHFVKIYGSTLNEKVILKNVDGDTWIVDVKRTRDGVFLENDGWRAFAHYHGLKVEEFLFFRYDGDYSFSVQIYGLNACKKETFKNIATCIKSEEATDEEMQPMQTSRKHAFPRSGEANKVLEKGGSSKQGEGGWEFQNGIERIFPKCPCFTSPSRGPKNQIFRTILIPREVIKEHNLKLAPEMILRNEKGEEWPVKITRFGHQQRMSIGKGLYEFLVDNNVRPTDTCKFTFETGKLCRAITVQIVT